MNRTRLFIGLGILLSAAAQAAKPPVTPTVTIEQVLQFKFHCDRPLPGAPSEAERAKESWFGQAKRHTRVFQTCVSEAFAQAPTSIRDIHPYMLMSTLLGDALPLIKAVMEPELDLDSLPSQKKAEAAFNRLDEKLAALTSIAGKPGVTPGARELRDFRVLVTQVRGAANDSANGSLGMFGGAKSALYFTSLHNTSQARQTEIRKLFCDWKQAMDAAIVWDRMDDRTPLFPRGLLNCSS